MADVTIDRRHPHHPRFTRVVLGPGARAASADDAAEVIATVRGAVADRRRGGVTVEWRADLPPLAEAETARFAAGVAHALGELLPETRNTDGRAMPATPHVRIELGYAAAPRPDLLHFADPRLPWPLHTDRALHHDVGDFLLVCKAVEANAAGGALRFLHLDDFARADEFARHPLGRAELEWKGDERFAPLWEQARVRREAGVRAAVFTTGPDGHHIRYTDFRFRRPAGPEQVQFLAALGDALAAEAERLPGVSLPVGGLYVVNNRFMLHGREGFANRPGFDRVLYRFCGLLPTGG